MFDKWMTQMDIPDMPPPMPTGIDPYVQQKISQFNRERQMGQPIGAFNDPYREQAIQRLQQMDPNYDTWLKNQANRVYVHDSGSDNSEAVAAYHRLLAGRDDKITEMANQLRMDTPEARLAKQRDEGLKMAAERTKMMMAGLAPGQAPMSAASGTIGGQEVGYVPMFGAPANPMPSMPMPDVAAIQGNPQQAYYDSLRMPTYNEAQKLANKGIQDLASDAIDTQNKIAIENAKNKNKPQTASKDNSFKDFSEYMQARLKFINEPTYVPVVKDDGYGGQITSYEKAAPDSMTKQQRMEEWDNAYGETATQLTARFKGTGQPKAQQGQKDPALSGYSEQQIIAGINKLRKSNRTQDVQQLEKQLSLYYPNSRYFKKAMIAKK